jgi:hypothetical protein
MLLFGLLRIHRCVSGAGPLPGRDSAGKHITGQEHMEIQTLPPNFDVLLECRVFSRGALRAAVRRDIAARSSLDMYERIRTEIGARNGGKRWAKCGPQNRGE